MEDSSDKAETLPFNLTDVNRATLEQTVEEVIPHDWEELKVITGMHAYHPRTCPRRATFVDITSY